MIDLNERIRCDGVYRPEPGIGENDPPWFAVAYIPGRKDVLRTFASRRTKTMVFDTEADAQAECDRLNIPK